MSSSETTLEGCQQRKWERRAAEMWDKRATRCTAAIHHLRSATSLILAPHLLHLSSTYSIFVTSLCCQGVWSSGVIKGYCCQGILLSRVLSVGAVKGWCLGRGVVNGCLVRVFMWQLYTHSSVLWLKPSRAHPKEKLVHAAVLWVFSGSQTQCLLTLLAEMTGYGCFIIWNFKFCRTILFWAEVSVQMYSNNLQCYDALMYVFLIVY